MTLPACSAYQQAIRLGQPKYFTGRRCAKGHLAERYTKSRMCCQCAYEYARSPEGRESQREARRKYHESHREQVREANRRRAVARSAARVPDQCEATA
jgi:hypothetical protein